MALQYDKLNSELPPINPALSATVPQAMKMDTDYYNDPLKPILDEYFLVNPIYEDPILQQFGTLDLTGKDAMLKYIQYEVAVAKSNGIVADDLVFTQGDSTLYPAFRKAKIFQYGIRLTELEYMSRDSPAIRAKVESQLQASKSFLTKNLLKWMVAYQALTSEIDYDPDWLGLLNLKAATGTASNPEDICSTAGTATAYAYNLTGTNKSKDFVLNTFGASQEVFRAKRDSTTGEQILRADLANNDFLWLMNPANVYRMKQTHPYNGVQDDQNITYYEQIMKLDGRHTVLGSYDVDATAAISEDGTNEVVGVANPKENFKIGYVIPYTVTGWDPIWVGGQKHYLKRAYMKVMPWVKPYYISGSWKKAMHSFTFVGFNDAG